MDDSSPSSVTFEHEDYTSKGVYLNATRMMAHYVTASNTSESFVTLDTEFIRQNTFFPQLSLLQMAYTSHEADTPSTRYVLIDAQSKHFGKDDLKPYILGPATCVMHSCRQDIEIFYNLYGALPHTIFDTQIGSIFLGLGENIAYSALVQHYLGYTLDKSQQHTNWSRRPLLDKQLRYAAQDVVFLHDLYPMMVEKLKACDRWTWALDEMTFLSDSRSLTQISDARIDRMKIPSALYPRMRAVLAYRDVHAQHHNVNRTAFLKDDVVRKVVQADTPEKVRELLKEHTRLCDTDIEHILTTWEGAPTTPEHIEPSKAQKKRIKHLTEYIEKVAHKLNLPPSFLGNKRDVYHYIMNDTGRLLSTWRFHALDAVG